MNRVLLTVLVAVLVAVPVSIGTVVIASQGSGLQGPRGAIGLRGEPGPAGPRGPRGRHGSDGTSTTSQPSAGVNPPVPGQAPDAGVDQTAGADDTTALERHVADLKRSQCAVLRTMSHTDPGSALQRQASQASLDLDCP